MVKISPSNTGAAGSIPGREANMSHDQKKQNIKQQQYCDKFNKDLKKYLVQFPIYNHIKRVPKFIPQFF